MWNNVALENRSELIAWAQVGLLVNSLIKIFIYVGGYRRENLSSESE
jgi:hypothetical protein